MKDSPEEISSVMNLLLPLDQQLPTGNDFIETFLTRKGDDLYTVKKDKIQELKHKFKGRVSFVKSLQSSQVKKEFIGGTKDMGLKYFKVNTVEMSTFQTQAYTKAVKEDADGEKGVYSRSRQASLFVFPDGSYGPKGFNNYVTKKAAGGQTFTAARLKESSTGGGGGGGGGGGDRKSSYSYKLTPDFIKALKGDNNEETFANLRKYSCKYEAVIRSILKAQDQCCFVYSESVEGGGVIVFAKILELFTIGNKNFTEAKGNESTPGVRFGLLYGSKKIHNIINRFNKVDNMHGNIIKILIGSRVVSEGVSFSNIQQEYIMTPWFNYSETDQVIARGYRLNSHDALLKAGEKPTVYISQMVAMPQKGKSIDLTMYKLSEDKDRSIQSILRLLMEAAFDCSLNYYRNHFTQDKDGQRECEYQKCDYKCDGINMKKIEDGLTPEEIDNSTYQLYYSNYKVNSIHKKLDKLFKKYPQLDFQTIFNFLEDEYTEKEVRNALSIIPKGENNLRLKNYKKIPVSPVKKIINKIEKIFKTNFRLSFNNIRDLVQDPGDKTLTQFEIVTALKNIIDENIIIKNKYGFTSYLRENKNIYFLVNGLSPGYDLFSDYYTRIPNIVTDNNFEDILHDTQINLMPVFINKLCKITKESVFSKLIKSLPDDVQELFIEAAILSKQQNLMVNTGTRTLILEYFVNYIHQIENTWISNRLNDGEHLRCLHEEKVGWTDCNETWDEKLKEKFLQRRGVLEQNPWGYYGKYNPEKNIFNIVNVREQINQQKIHLNAQIKMLDELVEEGKITPEDKDQELLTIGKDFRQVYSGKNCKSWGKPLLRKIAFTVLKIDFPNHFKKNISELKIKDEFKKENDKTQLYKDNELDDLTLTDLKRVLYWKDKNVNDLCNAIREWFAKTKFKGFDMLIPDKQIGGHGHIKKEKSQENKIEFIIQTIIPLVSPEEFKGYFKDIETLMNDSFGIKKYKPTLNRDRWVFILRIKKLVGFFIVNTKNVILDISIAKNYKRLNIGIKGIQAGIKHIFPTSNPKIILDNRLKIYIKIIKMYKDFGFIIQTNDGLTTTMEFKPQ